MDFHLFAGGCALTGVKNTKCRNLSELRTFELSTECEFVAILITTIPSHARQISFALLRAIWFCFWCQTEAAPSLYFSFPLYWISIAEARKSKLTNSVTFGYTNVASGSYSNEIKCAITRASVHKLKKLSQTNTQPERHTCIRNWNLLCFEYIKI